MFLTFEGIDGSGKSTQVRLLVKALQKRGLDIVFTREPGGTRISEKIREILLDTSYSEMTRETELLLYAASRAQHVGEMIRPALRAGKTVICERFTDSTVAYQGYGCGLDLGVIGVINRVATGGLKPDLTILLDIEVEEGLERAAMVRAHGQADRIESREREFYQRVREGYLKIAAAEPERVKVLYSSGKDQSSLHREILTLFEEITSL